MNTSKTVFTVIAALLPTAPYEGLRYCFPNINRFLLMIPSAILSFALLFFAFRICNRFFDRMSRYRGLWIERLHTDDPAGERISIGEIRYDATSQQDTFSGVTYFPDGRIESRWQIDMLQQSKDTVMQYICATVSPTERSIGTITFQGRNECVGDIWIVDGRHYRYEGERITGELAASLGFARQVDPYKRHFHPNEVRVPQAVCPDFVRRYASRP